MVYIVWAVCKKQGQQVILVILVIYLFFIFQLKLTSGKCIHLYLSPILSLNFEVLKVFS